MNRRLKRTSVVTACGNKNSNILFLNYWCEILKCPHRQCFNISLFPPYSEVNLNFQNTVPQKQNGRVHLIKPSGKKVLPTKDSINLQNSVYFLPREGGAQGGNISVLLNTATFKATSLYSISYSESYQTEFISISVRTPNNIIFTPRTSYRVVQNLIPSKANEFWFCVVLFHYIQHDIFRQSQFFSFRMVT